MSENNKTVVLLDGSMGQELVNRSGKPPTNLWASQALIDDPPLVQGLHEDYLKAGARVLTVNTYSCTPERLAVAGVEDQFEYLQRTALDVAIAARENLGLQSDVSIAGCLPPLVGSYLPDRSPDYQTSFDTYRKVVEIQQDRVDCFLCETVSSIADAKAVASAASQSGKPVWVALSVSDDNPQCIRSGEPLVDAQAVLKELGVARQLLNCSRPESIDSVFSDFAQRASLCGAYANGFSSVKDLLPGKTVEVLEAREDLDAEAYAKFAMKWVEEGAQLVGGCCEVGPQHISYLSQALQNAGYTISKGV